MNNQEFILVQDEDCHWYVIPEDKHGSWLEWKHSPNYELGVIPDYAEEVGGSPILVKFKDYRID